MLALTQDRRLNIQQQAGWSCKSWATVINDIFRNLNSEEVLGRLKMREKPMDTGDLSTCLQHAQCFFDLCVQVAAQRAWSMASHSECPPESWFGICNEDLEVAKLAKEKMKRDATVIRTAFRRNVEDSDNCDAQAPR